MKKMFKKFFASLMVAVMVLTAAPLSGFVGMELNLYWLNFDWLDFTPKASAATVTDSGICGADLTYTLYDDGEIVISGTGDMYNYEIDTVYLAPWFRYLSSIKSLTIENGVTSIGDCTFLGCSNLTSVTFPDSLIYIGVLAFQNCTNLTSVTIPNSVRTIGGQAFQNCSKLTSITIPDSVTSIGSYAFDGCTNLVSVTIPDSVISIGENVFEDTGYYKDSSNWEDDALYIGNHLIGVDKSFSGEYEIKEGTLCIAGSAFRNCTALTVVIIPDSVISFGDEAFYNCSKLASITIPESVTSIGSYAFYGCTGLTDITVPDSVTSIGYFAFKDTGYYKDRSNWVDNALYIGNHLIGVDESFSGEYEIKEGTLCIASSAFRNCTALTVVTIPDSVTGISDYAFNGCTGLVGINVAEGNTAYSSDEYGVLFNKDKTELIRYPALNGYKNYTIPDGVICISDDAFDDCTSLQKITIPDSVKNIGFHAFSFCEGLTSISVDEDNTVYSSDEYGVLFDKEKTVLINYPSGNTSETYAIPTSVVSVKYYAFYRCLSLRNITISNKVRSIGESAFEDVKLLNLYYLGTETEWNEVYVGWDNDSLSVPIQFMPVSGTCGDNLTWSFDIETGELIISGTGLMMDYSSSSEAPWYIIKTSIKTVTIEDGVTTIGDRSFSQYYALKNVVIADSVTDIGNAAFFNCTALNSVEVSKGVTTIGNSAFSDCYALKSIDIPYGVRSIGDSAFSQCESIPNIEIPDSVTYIGDGAFLRCRKITNIKIPNSISNIANALFEGCTNLTDLIIPNSIISIGYKSFYGCDSLTSITIPDSVTSIGQAAFAECLNLEEVIFKSSGYMELGEYLFDYCPKAMLCCEENSYLHTYAEANNMKFCLLDENGVPSFVVQNDVLLSYRGESTDVFVSAGTKIGYGAFENNSIVETVVLSSSVSRIHANAFRNCSSLTTVTIPESVTSIGAGAFDGCENLTIWCYAGSYADSYATANGINVEYIALDIEKDILILNLKGTSSLTASLNTPYAENTGVVWSSTNTSIATVDGNGNVKGIKAGTAVIVATSKEGGLRDYCVVKVVGIEALSTATIDHENGMISGITANADSLDEFITLSDPSCNLSYSTLGTDSTVYVKRGTEVVDAYTIVIFGDVNGDSWYDGQDAIIVDCLANGMLTKDDVGEAVYTAADCNHDGVIDQLDVDLLNQAGALLANVDQTKPTEVLLETSSAYVEYLDLIDQSPELDVEDETDAPEADAETEDTPEADTEDTKLDIFEMILNFIKSIFEMLLSYIPMPLK